MDDKIEAKRWERQRTDADNPGDQPPAHHDEIAGEKMLVNEPAEGLVPAPAGVGAIEQAFIDAWAEGGPANENTESTSAWVASRAGYLLGAANPLMRGSPFHSEVLNAIKTHTKQGVTGEMLDLMNELAKVIEPFMRDVRTVAASALTQFEGGLGAIAEDPKDE